MCGIIGMLCLCLLIAVQPARAQKVFPLSVSHHHAVTLDDDDVKTILAMASSLLQKKNGFRNTAGHVACNVGFELKGQVHEFASASTPSVIKKREDIEAVHKEPTDVKVVEEIGFCKGTTAGFWGCSWPHHFRSIIVVDPKRFRRDANFPHIVWAHEFGHLTGLWHSKEPDALMSICNLAGDQIQLDQRECDCYRGGPGTCHTPEVNPDCSTQPTR